MSHPVRNPRHGTVLGVVLVLTGAWLVYDSNEARGRDRPWPLRLIPG